MKFTHYIIGTTLLISLGLMLVGQIDRIGRGRDVPVEVIEGRISLSVSYTHLTLPTKA